MREGDAAFEALREAIDAFAAERAPELVADARAEALAKVRSMLAEAMAQSLLDHSGAAIAPERTTKPSSPRGGRRRDAAKPRRATRPTRAEAPPAAAPRDEPRAHEETGERGVYVYGVASSREATLPEGLDGVAPGEPVTLIEDAGLAAISSPVPLAEFGEAELHENLNDVAWLEATARGHERVLDEALARMTVVPMRLCTIYRGPEDVREMLARERDLLVDALARLEGKTEWGVKLFAAPGALERATAQGGGDQATDAGRSEGLAYLERKRREAASREEADRVADEWAAKAHARLAAEAAEALENPLQRPEVSGRTEEMVLNGVYLVDDERAGEFRRAVGLLAEEFRGRDATVELTGPWPPYNFVKSSIEAAR